MIILNNIKKQDNIVSTNVESIELNESQNYNLSFNLDNLNYSCSIENANKYDVSKIFYKLSSYVKEKKILPVSDYIVCF